jgi:hypothetical protein
MTANGFPAPLICLRKDCTAGSVRNRPALTAPPREQDRLVVLWIGVIQRLVDGERLGRPEIVLDGLDLAGFEREQLGPGTEFAQRADRFGQLGLLGPVGGGHGNS